MKNKKFVLIGCGRIGKRHAEHISNYGDLVAVCDTDTQKADDFGQSFNAKVFYDIDDFLKHSEKE